MNNNSDEELELFCIASWRKDNAPTIIQQWGIVTRVADETPVLFPKPFPNACYNVQLTLKAIDEAHDVEVLRAENVSASGFTYCAGEGEVTAFWFAIGS
ncbi:hypothetical protein B5C26_17330 [Photorhabdus luminescens]|uniref:Putative tail fiber protein gp53-like C-terminal domain-containing protein n=1 Tax=Photorhabdus luminescens subsp. mexicana TaxID=2100167 RepID=A0A4R4JJE7_PHOLU|nr:hypothetical protein [Photorhabdus luminescens]OWO80546.1 hypothetical protein B5C26_17330 [Photorhabdus luminescens]TDB54410.1 hypothetical protein C5468_04380 [Photorhabdus luminescens subsp. mexicana]